MCGEYDGSVDSSFYLSGNIACNATYSTSYCVSFFNAENIYFDGRGFTISSSFMCTGLNYNNVTNITISNVVYKTATIGSWLNNNSYISISNISMSGCQYMSIFLYNPAVYTINIEVYNSTFMDTCALSLYYSTSWATSVAYISFHNNTITGGSSGAVLSVDGGTGILEISGNNFSQISHSPVVASQMKGTVILHDNIFQDVFDIVCYEMLAIAKALSVELTNNYVCSSIFFFIFFFL